MEINEFDKLMKTYIAADVDNKINIYCTTQELTQDQYMELLRNFPRSEIRKLERVLA
ncbi:MAG: hypothetical protein K0R15_396 [Clostridiales bacterium]|jgi:hypothetical protein|nr:hypothetical protein [Clostridiales bacterium]